MKCLNCEKELNQIPKKRPKKFCNSTCRSNYWQKLSRAKEVPVKLKSEPTKNELSNFWKNRMKQKLGL